MSPVDGAPMKYPTSQRSASRPSISAQGQLRCHHNMSFRLAAVVIGMTNARDRDHKSGQVYSNILSMNTKSSRMVSENISDKMDNTNETTKSPSGVTQ